VLSLALRLPRIGYVGAMGSRRTHFERLERLRSVGVTDTELSRLSSPVGLDLGARTPEETAVSIAAEIIAARSGGSAVRLRDLDRQSIHPNREGVAMACRSLPWAGDSVDLDPRGGAQVSLR
jgi:xanthine dehydrogenase accessory factor